MLQGKIFQTIENSISFIESDSISEGVVDVSEFDRDLQSLIHQPEFEGVQGLDIGRFEKKFKMNFDTLSYIISTKKELKNMPIVGLGAGLYGGPDCGYGSAQRLYVKRGYIPDGEGVTYHYKPTIPGNSYPLDDDLVLWFTKKLGWFMAKIILLMGIGSTGKTTVTKQLVKILDENYSIDGFDHAVEISLDKKYWPDGELKHEGFQFVDGPNGPQMKVGPKGAEFLEFMISDIIRKAKEGQNIIIDYVLSDEDVARFKRELPDVKFITVGLKPPVDWVTQRELERGDRQVGIAKQAYEQFYSGKSFDIEFDTSILDSETIALKIKEFLSSSKKPSLK